MNYNNTLKVIAMSEAFGLLNPPKENDDIGFILLMQIEKIVNDFLIFTTK